MKIKTLSDYTTKELYELLKTQARQVGTHGTTVILKEILKRNTKDGK
jgi:hypothetical protein